MSAAKPSESIRVLVVDDEVMVVDVLRRYLEREGFVVDTAVDGPSALDSVARSRPDLVVLDLMLPGIDGMDVFRQLAGEIPVIMLTAKTDEADRVYGIEVGADDYVTKPFSPREVVARVRMVLRRYRNAATASGRPLTYDRFRLDVSGRTLEIDDDEVRLTPKEFELVHILAAAPGQVFSRDQLFEQVWDMPAIGDTTTVAVHIRRLREKLAAHNAQDHVQTVWGHGYKFVP